ncbi:MAG: hypothetical protein R3B84_17550 [Zavarzinella sp.]
MERRLFTTAVLCGAMTCTALAQTKTASSPLVGPDARPTVRAPEPLPPVDPNIRRVAGTIGHHSHHVEVPTHMSRVQYQPYFGYYPTQWRQFPGTMQPIVVHEVPVTEAPTAPVVPVEPRLPDPPKKPEMKPEKPQLKLPDRKDKSDLRLVNGPELVPTLPNSAEKRVELPVGVPKLPEQLLPRVPEPLPPVEVPVKPKPSERSASLGLPMATTPASLPEKSLEVPAKPAVTIPKVGDPKELKLPELPPPPVSEMKKPIVLEPKKPAPLPEIVPDFRPAPALIMPK